MASKMLDIAGLWLKKSKKPGAGSFFAGNINLPAQIIIGPEHSLMIFRNTKKKEGSQEPDYRAVLVYNDRPEPESGRASGRPTPDEDVPF